MSQIRYFSACQQDGSSWRLSRHKSHIETATLAHFEPSVLAGLNTGAGQSRPATRHRTGNPNRTTHNSQHENTNTDKDTHNTHANTESKVAGTPVTFNPRSQESARERRLNHNQELEPAPSAAGVDHHLFAARRRRCRRRTPRLEPENSRSASGGTRSCATTSSLPVGTNSTR